MVGAHAGDLVGAALQIYRIALLVGRGQRVAGGVRFLRLDFSRASRLCICFDLLDEGIIVQFLRVKRVTVHNAPRGQLFPQNFAFRAGIFFIGNRLLRLVQILPRGDQNVDALFDLGPFQELLTVAGVFSEFDAPGVVIQKADAAVLEIPALAPGAVLFFQKLDALFLRVIFSVVGCDARFAVLEAAAGCQRRPPIRLGKIKGGDFFSLRLLVDLCYLLRLSGEETQL